MRQIKLTAFDMACVGHIQQGLWRHPRDRAMDYRTLEHWVDLARLLERGLFDGLFLADVLGVYDVYAGSADAALRDAVQVPALDPLLLVPAMAAVTRHLGFGVTANLSTEAPYVFARRMSTLDHLTGGRIGWNVVTGYLDSAARALGRTQQAAHDDRYDAAEDFMEAVYALWEGSWADDAVKRDADADLYADPRRIRPVERHGAFGAMAGMHLCEPSPQRTPVLYQAGSSGRGRHFAARHAECVFVNGTTPAQVAAIVTDLRAQAAAQGRQPDALRVFVGATLVLGHTDQQAADKLAEYQRYASVPGFLAHTSGSLGVDVAALEPDQPIGQANSNAIVSNLDAMRQRPGPPMTRERLIATMQLGGRQTPIVGSPHRVADALQAWVEQADVDGFILARTVTPECWQDVVELLVPELQRRGVYKTQYAPGTLREKLTGGATGRLPREHPAASYRWDATPS